MSDKMAAHPLTAPAGFVGTDVTFRVAGGLKTYPLREPVVGPGVFTFSVDDEGFAVAQRVPFTMS